MRATPCPAPSASSHPRDKAVKPPAGRGGDVERNVCGAAVGNKTRGLQEGLRENCVKFVDSGSVQLGMKSQGMLPGGGIPR